MALTAAEGSASAFHVNVSPAVVSGTQDPKLSVANAVLPFIVTFLQVIKAGRLIVVNLVQVDICRVLDAPTVVKAGMVKVVNPTAVTPVTAIPDPPMLAREEKFMEVVAVGPVFQVNVPPTVCKAGKLTVVPPVPIQPVATDQLIPIVVKAGNETVVQLLFDVPRENDPVTEESNGIETLVIRELLPKVQLPPMVRRLANDIDPPAPRLIAEEQVRLPPIEVRLLAVRPVRLPSF